MTISAVSNVQPITVQPKPVPKHGYFNPANVTGYGTLGCAIGSIAAIKNKSFKWHKNLAYAAGALALIHAGIIEWFHHNKRKQ